MNTLAGFFRSWPVQAFLGASMFGIAVTMLRYALIDKAKLSPMAAIITISYGLFAASLVAQLVFRPTMNFSKPVLSTSLALGLIYVGANLFYICALSKTNPGLPTTINLGTQSLVVLALAVFVFKAPIKPINLPGIPLMIAAVYYLTR